MQIATILALATHAPAAEESVWGYQTSEHKGVLHVFICDRREVHVERRFADLAVLGQDL